MYARITRDGRYYGEMVKMVGNTITREVEVPPRYVSYSPNI